ncbi:non-heme chloroperoxidase [Bradyrhizobium sp. USDA 4532]|nr:non-heme chloroperoxidase [Bradyrhizobium sp. USDA 4545]MCP1921093.1 non-heme chloroperoxidase [Bradyrhizobium sp. USDA 4532]
MAFVKTKDGTDIFYKDWGPKDAQPIHFHHGWPLSADDWDNQMLFFLKQGFRVVAHDRRGHGRSSQVSEGHDMDHYAADASAVAEHLDLRNAIHIGHSTGGGQVARYVAQHGQPQGRVAKAVLVSSVPPLMVKTDANPEGTPIAVFDGFRAALAANRAQFFLDVPAGPFYGYNRPGAKPSQGVIENWWRQGMMGSAKAHYEGIKAFSETDQTADLKAITVPTLVMQGDDDQVVPYGPLQGGSAHAGQAAAKQQIDHLSRFLARDAHGQRRCDQRRSSRVHPWMNDARRTISGALLSSGFSKVLQQ